MGADLPEQRQAFCHQIFKDESSEESDENPFAVESGDRAGRDWSLYAARAGDGAPGGDGEELER